MSVISIKNRLARLEDENGIGRLPMVMILPGLSDDEAYAASGLRPGDPAQVLRIQLVSARAA